MRSGGAGVSVHVSFMLPHIIKRAGNQLHFISGFFPFRVPITGNKRARGASGVRLL